MNEAKRSNSFTAFIESSRSDTYARRRRKGDVNKRVNDMGKCTSKRDAAVWAMMALSTSQLKIYSPESVVNNSFFFWADFFRSGKWFPTKDKMAAQQTALNRVEWALYKQRTSLTYIFNMLFYKSIQFYTGFYLIFRAPFSFTFALAHIIRTNIRCHWACVY